MNNPDEWLDLTTYGNIFLQQEFRFDYIQLVKCYSRLILNTFDGLGTDEKDDIVKCHNGAGEYIEAGYIEAAVPAIEAYEMLHLAIMGELDDHGNDLSLLLLLILAHDIEYIIRPHLLRVNWMAQRCTGENTRYSTSQLNRKQDYGSIGHAVKALREWLDSKGVTFLRPKELKALSGLLNQVDNIDGSELSMENLRNWIDHRSFIITENFVILNLHPNHGHRIKLTKIQLTYLFYLVNDFCRLLVSLNNLFDYWCLKKLNITEQAAHSQQFFEENSISIELAPEGIPQQIIEKMEVRIEKRIKCEDGIFRRLQKPAL